MSLRCLLTGIIAVSGLLLSREVSAQIRFETQKGSTPSEVKLKMTLDYGALAAPLYALKQSRKGQLDGDDSPKQAGDCNIDYRPNEYPVGCIVDDAGAEKKYLMVQDSEGRVKHPTIQYTDKRSTRELTVKFEVSRDFPETQSPALKLLNPTQPGFSNRTFPLSQSKYGESVFRIYPGKREGGGGSSILYTESCEFLPGAEIQSEEFAGSYTWLCIGGSKCRLARSTASFSGHMGGAKFDSIRMCTLTKHQIVNSSVRSEFMGFTEPPKAVGLISTPPKISISGGASWLFLAILGFLSALILGVVWPLIVGIVTSLSLTLATQIFAASFSFVTQTQANGVQQQMFSRFSADTQRALEAKLGTGMNEFGKAVGSRATVVAGQLTGELNARKPSDAAAQNGQWAVSVLLQPVIPFLAMAQAQNTVFLEKYLQRTVVEFDELRAECMKAAEEALEPVAGASAESLASSKKLQATVQNVCGTIDPRRITFDFFQPLRVSREAGCYGSTIDQSPHFRLEEVEDRKQRVAGALLNRIDSSIASGAGSPFAGAVRAALASSIQAADLTQSGNWWSQQSSDSGQFCGFDNVITFNFNTYKESALISCVWREIRESYDKGGLAPGSIAKNCNYEIKAVAAGN